LVDHPTNAALEDLPPFERRLPRLLTIGLRAISPAGDFLIARQVLYVLVAKLTENMTGPTTPLCHISLTALSDVSHKSLATWASSPTPSGFVNFPTGKTYAPANSILRSFMAGEVAAKRLL